MSFVKHIIILLLLSLLLFCNLVKLKERLPEPSSGVDATYHAEQSSKKRLPESSSIPSIPSSPRSPNHFSEVDATYHAGQSSKKRLPEPSSPSSPNYFSGVDDTCHTEQSSKRLLLIPSLLNPSEPSLKKKRLPE